MRKHLGTLVLGAAVLFVAIVIASGGDLREEIMQEKDYCEMVRIWEESNGEFGWPPRASIDC